MFGEAIIAVVYLPVLALTGVEGKLFRPTITLLADQATGGPTARSVTVAAVIELIHLATLVHDDSVDHSVLRRGMPTINALFSHQISVIMGDYLYSRAVIELVRLDEFDTLRVLSRVTNEMTVGEMRQLLAHDPLAFSEEQYDLLIRAKTASLLSGAAEVGALTARPAERAALRRFGEALGMAFQIVDDILDFTGDQNAVGKPLGSDLLNGLVTLPAIYYAEAHPHDPDVLSLPQGGWTNSENMARLIENIRGSKAVSRAMEEASGYIDRALAHLDPLPPCTEREALESLARYIVDRRF